MVDRYRVWLGAGVLAGGMSAAALTGAGVAAAEDGSASSTESQSTTGSDDHGSSGAVEVDSDDSENADQGGEDTHEPESEDDDGVETAPGADTDVQDAENVEDTEDRGNTKDRENAEDAEDVEEAPDQRPEEPADPDAPAQTDTEAGLPSPFVTSVETDFSSREGAAVMQTEAVQSPGIVTGLLNLLDTFNDIGTAFYNFYTGAMQFLAGPARPPFGSRVRVESSSLTIVNGFGDEVVVPVDWYFPPDKVEPKGLIYLQHGMLATSAFYGATAAYLAEKTHSIVVAPTLTWNIFDFENLPLMLSHTHRAIADLFAGDRAALTASARAAGYTTALPTKIVLAGHSAGGGLVVGSARYMVERGLGADLAGVVMLDGAGFATLSQDLAKIPRSIPVYNLAADPDTWNNFGDATRRLVQERPDSFTGVVIVGGRHSDSMQSCSMLIQLAAYFATGFSSPFNIAINQALASGWISDMLDGTRNPRLYGSSGSGGNTAAGLLTGTRSTSVTLTSPTGKIVADVCVGDRPGSACSSVPNGIWHA